MNGQMVICGGVGSNGNGGGGSGSCSPCGGGGGGGVVFSLPQPVLQIKRLHPGAVMPKYATAGAACFDLVADLGNSAVAIGPGRSYSIGTGLAFEIQPGYAVSIKSRSGLAFNKGVLAFHGTIDADYRGEVRVLLWNTSDKGIRIENGDRIAQAMLVEALRAQLVEVDELSETARGAGGLGSTGA